MLVFSQIWKYLDDDSKMVISQVYPDMATRQLCNDLRSKGINLVVSYLTTLRKSAKYERLYDELWNKFGFDLYRCAECYTCYASACDSCGDAYCIICGVNTTCKYSDDGHHDCVN